MIADFERCYRAVQSRDPRFDGWFYTAVASTGVYCRPSCPAATPKRENVRFYPTAAAANEGGFRACKRCRPDATPGSPEWSVRADLVGRAMRLISDGVVDREGTDGLSRRLGYSDRHVHRQLCAEVGAGPLALARTQRAQTARTLIETTQLTFAEVAFASGFSSIRQFNDTIREMFAVTPMRLRRDAGRTPSGLRDCLTLRLPYRAPCDVEGTVAFLADRAVPGVEEWDGNRYRRSLSLPHGSAVVDLAAAAGHVHCVLRLDDLRDVTVAVQRCRRLLDLDADPTAVDAVLGADPLLTGLVRARPGRRVPGAVDGPELALRAVLGQQVSVAAARTLAGRIVALAGKPLTTPVGAVTHLFPGPEAVAALNPDDLPLPGRRRRTLVTLSAMLSDGDLVIDPGANREHLTARLQSLPGIGVWTAGYVRMRALADPDVFLPTDLGARRAVSALGLPDDAARVRGLAERWRPWRSYALLHLWGSGKTSRKLGPSDPTI